jgi:rod shape-determining protein MreC
LYSFVRAWYVFVGLAFLTFAFTAFVGRVPTEFSASVALPPAALYRAGAHLRATVDAIFDRRQYQARIDELETLLAASEGRASILEWQVGELETLLSVRRSQSPAALLTVPVVGRSSGGVSDTLLLGRGLGQGVEAGMPVTAPEGLVGLVVGTTERTAVVRTLLDPQSRVGVTVRGRGGQGVAVGDVAGLVRVERFMGDTPIEVGDVVETNAVGGLFPRGLRVGVVVALLPQDPNELRRGFLVAPAVDVGSLLDVVLIAPP